jgi:hypothetical protein
LLDKPKACKNSWLTVARRVFDSRATFPDIEAVQKYMAVINELNVFRYVEATNLLGTKMELQ